MTITPYAHGIPATSGQWQRVLHAMTHPVRHPLSDDEALNLYNADASLLPFENGHITLWHWGGHGPRVLLVHGWESRSTHWHAWKDALLDAGFEVHSLDLPAHGHATGTETDVVQCGRAVLAAAATLASLHGVVSHSMGSAACLYAFAQGLQVRASVHLAGPSSVQGVLRRAAQAHGLDATCLNALYDAFATRIGMPLPDMALPALGKGLRHPALIAHAPEDKEVPVEESIALASAWPLAQLMTTPGTGHRRILFDRHVIRQGLMTLALDKTAT